MGNSASYPYCITFDDVQAAAKRIQGTAHVTPVLTCQSLNPSSQQKLFFKVEALQRTGSFKFRGAYNAVRTILEEQQQVLDDDKSMSISVVTHSSGNHAQALAKAAQLASNDNSEVKATICMPENTPSVKKQAVVDFGGTVVVTENNIYAREEAATKLIHDTNGYFVHPSEDSRVIAGQGTVCLELIQQMKERGETLDAVIIPVGGGGLASGNAVTLRALLGDHVKIILAEPEELDDAHRSFHAGKLLKHKPDNKLQSVADGLRTTLGPNTWPIVRDLVDDVITVSEHDILQATKLVWERLKICIEPSAGVGVAVARSQEFADRYGSCRNICVVLCGGNVDVVRIANKMQEIGL